MPSVMDHAFRELNPENLDRIPSMYHFKSMVDVEEICKAAGFHIVESLYYENMDREFDNCESLCSLLQATTHGAFDPRLATEERLARFCSQYASKEDGTYRIRSKEGHIRSTVIASKPVVYKQLCLFVKSTNCQMAMLHDLSFNF